MSDTAHNVQDSTESGFQDLGVEPDLIAALQRRKLSAPTEIQQHLIPAVLEGKDCLARASTGAGKTNAYLLPILQRLTPGDGLQALVIQPTRSLALQLERNLRRFAPERPLRTAVAVGGRRSHGQPDPLADAPDVLIATPRGAAELARRGRHDWSTLRIVVIDEADAILDDRGPEQLRQVHTAFEHEHQTILIAGDLDEQVRALADEVLRDPIEIDVAPGAPRAASATQAYFLVDPQEKFDALVSFCKQESPRLAIVLANSEQQARDLARRLQRMRISCRWIGTRHPPRWRDQRGRHPQRSRSEVIVASDPAPRRLSTIPASHLLHYELPDDLDIYLHRLRQTARLRKYGSVIAFVEPSQHALVERIERRIDKPLKKLATPQRPNRSRREPISKPGGEANTAEANPSVGGRLSQVLHRDEELEARGIQPVPRTLGSRFRSTRRGKPLRRPGPSK
ncbi:MAG: DEAD/DEAH box helicase [Phycisphaerae bacterium]